MMPCVSYPTPIMANILGCLFWRICDVGVCREQKA